MKVAPKVVFLLGDRDGFGAAITDSLHPNPNSSLHRLEDSFELSLERYGVKDCKACGDIIQFVDDKGVFQVSVLLLQKYEPPILACAIKEVLTCIMGKTPSTLSTLVVPFVVPSSKLKSESKYSTMDSSKIPVFGVQIGPETDITRSLVSRTQKPPLSLQIHYEPLACLLQLAQVLKLPTFVLIGQQSESLSDKDLREGLEIIYDIGELLASTTCLYFLRDKIAWKPTKTSRDTEEPWRALYG